MQYAIVELEDGLLVVEVPTGMTLEEVALQNRGVLADENVYDSYDEACDALAELEPDEGEG